MSYIGTLYQVQYIQDSCLFMVRFRQVSLQIAENMNTRSLQSKIIGSFSFDANKLSCIRIKKLQ